MSGLEILGAVAASIEVVKAIRSSIAFLNDARNVPKHVNQQHDLRLQLVVQITTFESWCEEIGVSGLRVLGDLENSRERETMQQRLEVDLRLANNDIARSVLEMIVRLKDKFEEASNILECHDAFPAKIGPKKEDEKPKPKSKRFRMFSRNRQEERDNNDQGESKTGSFTTLHTMTKSLQWVANDRKAFQTLLEGITHSNNDLMALLEQGQRRRARRQAKMAALNEIPTGPDTLEQLPEDDELTTLAKIKTLQEESRERLSVSAVHKQVQVRIYRVDEFQSKIEEAGDARSICQIKEETVFVEWKFYSTERPIRMERMLQLGNLVRLLNERHIFSKFLAPRCKGLVNDDKGSRVGIVFATSITPSNQLQDRPPYQMLQTLIRETSASSSAIPPLGARFEMAQKLALAMHHLHCVGWLHKSFRSDNIIFFDDIATKQTSTKLGTTPHIPAMHLVGWDLSRPDSPSEFSESLSNSLPGFQSRMKNTKLYSHPDIHSTSSTKVRYRAQFDIYSLGLVLLEIGHWRTLDMIRKKCTSDEDFREKLKHEWCDKLQSRMGTVYWRATQRCLLDDFDVNTSKEGATSDFALQEAFQKQIVSKLEECFA